MNKRTGGSQFIVGGKTHYERNKTKYIKNSQLRRMENTKYIQSLKAGKSCIDCGYNKHLFALDFDHLPEFPKICNISSNQCLSWSKEKIDLEIAKCELVCANCHRIRTYNRYAGLDYDS